MALIRWYPSREMTTFPSEALSLQREMNRVFNSFFRAEAQEDSDLYAPNWLPALDVAEQDDEYLVKVELPGVGKDDIKITIQDNILTVRGEKKAEVETKKMNLHRVERSYGSFQRSVTLPASVQGDKIDASFKDGILSITVPKAEEVKRKQIVVNVK